jgi:ribosomal protein S8
MTRTSVLNDCLNAINNAEKQGKRQVMIRPSSKVIVKFLSVMQKHGMLLVLLYLEKEIGNIRCGNVSRYTTTQTPGLCLAKVSIYTPTILPFKVPAEQHAKNLHIALAFSPPSRSICLILRDIQN